MASFQGTDKKRTEPRLSLHSVIDESSQWRRFQLRDDLMTVVAYYDGLCLLFILRRRT